MHKHKVTLPDGYVATRNSKTRVYQYAIAVALASEKKKWAAHAGWGVWGWSGDRLNAEKAAGQAHKVYAEVLILDAELEENNAKSR